MNSLKSEESKLEQNLRLVIWALLKQRLEMEREFITVQTFRVFSFIFFAKLNSLPKSLTVERAWRRRKIQKEKFQKTRTQRNRILAHMLYILISQRLLHRLFPGWNQLFQWYCTFSAKCKEKQRKNLLTYLQYTSRSTRGRKKSLVYWGASCAAAPLQ